MCKPLIQCAVYILDLTPDIFKCSLAMFIILEISGKISERMELVCVNILGRFTQHSLAAHQLKYVINARF